MCICTQPQGVSERVVGWRTDQRMHEICLQSSRCASQSHPQLTSTLDEPYLLLGGIYSTELRISGSFISSSSQTLLARIFSGKLEHEQS